MSDFLVFPRKWCFCVLQLRWPVFCSSVIWWLAFPFSCTFVWIRKQSLLLRLVFLLHPSWSSRLLLFNLARAACVPIHHSIFVSAYAQSTEFTCEKLWEAAWERLASDKQGLSCCCSRSMGVLASVPLETAKIWFLQTLGIWRKLGPEPFGSYVKLAPTRRKCWKRLALENNSLGEASLRENGEGYGDSEIDFDVEPTFLEKGKEKSLCRGPLAYTAALGKVCQNYGVIIPIYGCPSEECLAPCLCKPARLRHGLCAGYRMPQHKCGDRCWGTDVKSMPTALLSREPHFHG